MISIPQIILSKADPRYLVNIQRTLKYLNKLELSDSEIEWLFLNPAHELYQDNSTHDSVRLIELELKEDNSVDVCLSGQTMDQKPILVGSKEDLDYKIDKSIIHPISVFHWEMDINALNSLRVLLNNEPDFKVLLYWVAAGHENNDDYGLLSVQVQDFEIEKLEEYADRIYSLLGSSCASVNYHSFELDVYSPQYYFTKGFPKTTCGLIIDKTVWDGDKFQKTQNDASVFCTYLQKNNCTNFLIIDENPEFWKITFETTVLWGDILYNKMYHDGFFNFRIFSDANDSGFLREKYPRTHWRIVNVRGRSNVDDEETVMRAISSGYGEPYGRD